MLIDELLRQNDTLSLCYIYCILRLPVHFGSIKNNILSFSSIYTSRRDGSSWWSNFNQLSTVTSERWCLIRRHSCSVWQVHRPQTKTEKYEKKPELRPRFLVLSKERMHWNLERKYRCYKWRTVTWTSGMWFTDFRDVALMEMAALNQGRIDKPLFAWPYFRCAVCLWMASHTASVTRARSPIDPSGRGQS